MIRIHKYLRDSWVCSRRKAEEYIRNWYIKVNWELATIWQTIDPEKDKIQFDDKIIKNWQEFLYFKLNKPAWVVTTCANIWEQTIMDVIDIDKRVFPIWRLDKPTTWLILLTNDWRLANYLMHPKYNHEKEYIVETFWSITDEQLHKISSWVFILWSYTKKALVKRISSWKFSITITEWRNRQIRRMVESVWSKVKKLKRIRIENILLWDLQIWEYKHLTKKELKDLFDKIWVKQDFV